MNYIELPIPIPPTGLLLGWFSVGLLSFFHALGIAALSSIRLKDFADTLIATFLINVALGPVSALVHIYISGAYFSRRSS